MTKKTYKTSPYSETTFKNSKYTVFATNAQGGKQNTAYNLIAIQAPEGVAVEIMQKNGLDPYEQTCTHCGNNFSIYEDVEKPEEFLTYGGSRSLLIIPASNIGYLDAELWYIEPFRGVKSRI